MEKLTVREQLDEFYKKYYLGKEGGLAAPYVKIDLTPKLHLYFPNFDARRKAVVRHDIHHLITEYPADIKGESEISAWEIASGCKKYWAAFLIDISGVMVGIPFNLWNVLKAFSRGRRTKNMYHDHIPMEEALEMSLNELQKHLQLDIHTKDSNPTVADFVLFLMFALFGVVYSILIFPLLPVVIFYTLYIEMTKNKINKRSN